MDTASIGLSKELYTLSKWDYLSPYDDIHPVYDLGYLLRQLPKSMTTFWGRAYPASPCLLYSGTQWVAFYKSEMTGEHNTDQVFTQFADTPEDAVCQLAIEMFKAGVLPHE